jgi:formate dehydrogenase
MMNILLLVRNFVPAHEMIERGDWKVSDIARNAFDLEGKVIGTIGAGRWVSKPRHIPYYDLTR